MVQILAINRYTFRKVGEVTLGVQRLSFYWTGRYTNFCKVVGEFNRVRVYDVISFSLEFSLFLIFHK